MNRRRFLITTQATEPSLTVSDLELGTGVKFGNYVYIIVSYSTGYRILLRDTLLGARAYTATVNTLVDYDGSDVDNYLVNTFATAFSSKLQSYMVSGNISYTVGNNGYTSSKTIARKVYLPGYSALFNNNTWKNSLKTYYGVTSDNSCRIAKSGGQARAYWTRDAATTAKYVQIVLVTGANGTAGMNASNYVRPCINVTNDMPIKLIDGVYTAV